MTDKAGPPSARTRIKRYHWLADYDRKTVEAILDAMPMCHVGYVHDGHPYVTPTLQWREGDRVYWHGSSASKMLKSVSGREVCLTVSMMDGLVVARSAFNFNVNFRSVMIFGRAEKIEDPDEKRRILKVLLNRFVPGHWDNLRPITGQELKASMVVSMPINETSAKVRFGPPQDEEDDYAFPVWAGVVPIRHEILAPEPDPRNLPGVVMPETLMGFRVG